MMTAPLPWLSSVVPEPMAHAAAFTPTNDYCPNHSLLTCKSSLQARAEALRALVVHHTFHAARMHIFMNACSPEAQVTQPQTHCKLPRRSMKLHVLQQLPSAAAAQVHKRGGSGDTCSICTHTYTYGSLACCLVGIATMGCADSQAAVHSCSLRQADSAVMLHQLSATLLCTVNIYIDAALTAAGLMCAHCNTRACIRAHGLQMRATLKTHTMIANNDTCLHSCTILLPCYLCIIKAARHTCNTRQQQHGPRSPALRPSSNRNQEGTTTRFNPAAYPAAQKHRSATDTTYTIASSNMAAQCPLTAIGGHA